MPGTKSFVPFEFNPFPCTKLGNYLIGSSICLSLHYYSFSVSRTVIKETSEVEVCLVVGISAIRDLTISGSVVLIPSDVNPTVAADISSSVVKESVARGTIVSVSVLKLLMVCSNGDSVVSVFVDCSVSNVSP